MKKFSILFLLLGAFALTEINAQSTKKCCIIDGICVPCPAGTKCVAAQTCCAAAVGCAKSEQTKVSKSTACTQKVAAKEYTVADLLPFKTTQSTKGCCVKPMAKKALTCKAKKQVKEL